VVAAGIDDHVGTFGYVALKTACPAGIGIMKMMLPAAVFFRQVAAITQGVSLHVNLPAVRFVAIGANHPGLVHLALQEGTVHVIFFQNLPVREIEGFFKQPGKDKRAKELVTITIS